MSFIKIATNITKNIKLIIYYTRHAFLNQSEKAYIEHNIEKWKEFKIEEKKSDGIILVDLFPKNSLIHFWSYLVNILAKRTNSSIKYFYIGIYKNKVRNFKFITRVREKIYKSFNVDVGISQFNFEYSDKDIAFYQKKFDGLKKSKSNLIIFSIGNIKLGDLIFDSYCRGSYKKTIDFEDKYLKECFFKALKLYFTTKEYFKKNKITAVCPSHVCYFYGIIARIAANNNIPIIKVNADNRGNENFRINLVDQKYVNEEPSPYFNFKKTFKKLTKTQKKRGLILGKAILKNRLKGNYEPTLSYMKISQFDKNLKKTDLIKKNDRKKIFIFPHCYFDNVHRFRSTLFTDFGDQINFLLKLSKKYHNYDWYYKPHPHELSQDLNIHKQMLKNYPNVLRLDYRVGHNQIIESNPYCIITNHGTVGHEYAAFKVPVIFTGDNKHINYKFGLHAKSKKQIEQAIMNNKLFERKIVHNKNELYEFIYLNYIHFQDLYGRKELLKDNYFNSKNRMISDSSKCFDHVIKYSKDGNDNIFKYIENFINSKDFKKYLS